MADPIGVTFMPSADPNQPTTQGGETGPGGSDLSDAFKILSLHLPQTVGPRSLASDRLLTARGASGSGFNPHAAVFAALLRSLLGQGPAPTLGNFQVAQPGGSRTGNQTTAPTTPDFPTSPTPRIVPGTPIPPPPPRTTAGDLTSPPMASPDLGSDPSDYQRPGPGHSYY